MAEEGSNVEETESADARYKRRVGVALAVLAVLGAWIAILQTNAGTNESRTAREATRMAAESQRAQVVAQGVANGFGEVLAQSDAITDRGAFRATEDVAADLGVPIDPARSDARLEAAQSEVEAALGPATERVRDIREEARRSSLEQAAVVEERVTWNARASQYETVMTTLGVAIFLVGFTLVVSRRTRPPIAVPALVLAAYCFGWAVHIYLKPIPDVDRAAIDAVAAGEVALDDGRATDAFDDFDRAIAADDRYSPAWEGRGLARLLEANPDLLTTFAVTDTSADVLGPASSDIDEALEVESEPSAQTLSGAALVAVVETDWERAESLLEDAIERNSLTPGLELSRVAVLAAQGEGDRAREGLVSAVEKFADLEGTDTARSLTARFLTLLEWVEANEADRADLVADLRADTMRLATQAAGDGAPLPPPPSEDVEVTIAELSFDRGVTRVAFDELGLAPGTPVAIAGYERPAPGASWVQPAALFYAGEIPDSPPAEPIELRTARSCAPVEYRFDIWVGGQLVDQVTGPGVEATC